MRNLIFTFIAVWILVGPLPTMASPTTVFVRGDTIIIDGPIESGLFARVQRAYGDQIRKIQVTSPGGDVSEGISIAELVRDKNLTVEVKGMCGSSCANYIFMAAKQKKVFPGGQVCFHGNSNTSTPNFKIFREQVVVTDRDKLSASQLEENIRKGWVSIQRIQKREREFYASIGMKVDLGFFNLENYAGYDWVCPTKAGFARFGISGIEGLPSNVPATGPGKIYLDDGLNPPQKKACSGDLRNLFQDQRCKRNQSDFDCLIANRLFLASGCSQNLNLPVEATVTPGATEIGTVPAGR